MNYLELNQIVYNELDFELMQHRRESAVIDLDENDIRLDYQDVDKNAKILAIILTDYELSSIISITSEYPIKKDKKEIDLCTIKTQKAHTAAVVVNTYSNIVGNPSEIMKQIKEFIKDYGLKN